jgi:hypothetical protein
MTRVNHVNHPLALWVTLQTHESIAEIRSVNDVNHVNHESRSLPDISQRACRYPLTRLRQHSGRLLGHMVHRFTIIPTRREFALNSRRDRGASQPSVVSGPRSPGSRRVAQSPEPSPCEKFEDSGIPR